MVFLPAVLLLLASPPAQALRPSTGLRPLAPSSASTSLAPAIRTVVNVVAFSDDGQRALLQETTTVAQTTQTTLLFADVSGITERLPISDRTAGFRKDRVDADVCEASADRVSAVARDFRGINVIIGLCASTERNVVITTQRVGALPISAQLEPVLKRAGFPGTVFFAGRDGIYVVVGSNVDGTPRIAVVNKGE